MKLSTLYSLMLMFVKNKRVITREEIADRYKIAKRTAQRNIEQLVEAGIPIEAVPGKDGGYKLRECFRLDSALFSREDFSRLSICLDALSQTFKDELTQDLIAKLYLLAENCEADDGVNITPHLVIDGESWNHTSAKSVKLDSISAAIASCTTLDISYIDREGRNTRRMIDPYSLALKEGIWYVYAKCHLHNEFRLFRMARIKYFEVTNQTFKRNGGNVREALKIELGEPIHIKLFANDKAIAGLEEWFGTDVVRAKDNGYIVETDVGDGEELVRRLLSYGTNIKILSPDTLSHQLKIMAEGVSSLY